jgi:putative ABC transport system ATP-binding protein
MAVSLYRYAWKHTRREQIWMLVIVVLSIVPLFASLNLPKLIVNGPIQGEGYESGNDATQTFLDLNIPVPGFISQSGDIALFPGFDLDRFQALFVLSGLFLALVIINGAFKYYLNTFKGRLGERMLRRMRYEFVDLVLRFPIQRFRQLRSPEIASMIKDELEPIGGFIGDAFVTPVYLISQVLTAIVFIFEQSLTLGMVALGVMGIQVIIIPRMRRRLLVLGRQRQLTARQFAGRVGEIVEGISSVHTNDTSNWERAGVAAELGQIFLIRFDIYQWKFLVKFLNNFLSQITPFIFYLFGGYFAITGQLDIGQLVAVIAAYKELPSPLKDLIDWDQIRLDVQVKYDQVVEQFDIDDVADEALQAPTPDRVAPLVGAFAISSLGLLDESEGRLVEQVTLDLPLDERVAAIGSVGSGGEHVAEVLARLRLPTSGQVMLAGKGLPDLPESVTGRRIGYVEAATYFPRTSLREALLYGLKRHPVAGPQEPPKAKTRKKSQSELARHETIRSGNTLLDVSAEWIDVEEIGLSDPSELGGRIGEILRVVLFERDVQLFGLRARVPAEMQDDAAETILAARQAFRGRLAEAGMEAYVEAFDPDRYILNATIMENIVFGAPRDPRVGLAQFYVHDHAKQTLRATGLAQTLYEMGRDIAATMLDLFGDLEPGNPLLQRLSIMTPDELGDYRQVLLRAAGKGFEESGQADRVALIRLALGYAEPRQRLGLIDEAFMAKVVETRQLFRKEIPEELDAVIVFHEAETFNPAASIQDNVLFGRIAYDLANATDAVEGLLVKSLDDLGLSPIVQEAGLAYDLGAGAKRLSLGQQQKLALARSLLKAPDYLIVNRGLSALDSDTQRRIVEMTLQRGKAPDNPFGTFWVLANSQLAECFERIVEFDNGHVVADFRPGEKPVPEIETAAPETAEAEKETAERRRSQADAIASREPEDQSASAEAPAGQLAV